VTDNGQTAYTVHWGCKMSCVIHSGLGNAMKTVTNVKLKSKLTWIISKKIIMALILDGHWTSKIWCWTNESNWFTVDIFKTFFGETIWTTSLAS